MHPFRNQPFLTRVRRFFSYRYGIDALYGFLIFLSFAAYLLGMILRLWPMLLLSLAFLFYAVWRAMSYKHLTRRKENERFKAFFRFIFRPFARLGVRIRYRRTHVFRRCPHCRNTLRLPRVKGAHTVRCPRCNNRFDTKVR